MSHASTQRKTSPVERVAIKFTVAEAALKAAEGHFPVDYLLVIGGQRHRPSDYALNAAALRCALSEHGFGTRPNDAVFVWLPVH